MEDKYTVDEIVKATHASKSTITRTVKRLVANDVKINRYKGRYNSVLYDTNSFNLIVQTIKETKEWREKRAKSIAKKSIIS